jgi:aminoglycoside phosphotransferase (APT) family kinase protein
MRANDDIIGAVPAVHLFDEEAHVMIIEDCGMDTRTLKQLVIDEALPQTVAEEIGAAIGRFLARIHAWNKEASFDMGIFADNEVGKMITSWVTYDRLISTLGGKDNIAAMADPVLDIPRGKLDVISKLAETRSYEIKNTSESFTHGDFWPGNIMVSLRRESEGGTPRLDKLYVLDWELAKIGLQGLDVGQFCAEMRLLERFYPNHQEGASTIMKSFLSAYKEGSGSDEALARVAVAHVGAHLVAWTPRVQWGGREKTREVVSEGVELLAGGAEGTRAWLEGSLVGNLLL